MFSPALAQGQMETGHSAVHSVYRYHCKAGCLLLGLWQLVT